MSYFTKYVCFYKLNDNNTLMLNTLTSAMDIIDNSTYNNIQNMIHNGNNIDFDHSDSLYNTLLARGYIFESSSEEKRIIDTLTYINKKFSAKNTPKNFVICPTMGCNLRCTYCFEGHEQHDKFKLLSDEQLNVIFEYISKHIEQKEKTGSNFNKPYISLFGGEPLLKCNFHIVEKILKFAYEKNISVFIISNATTIDDDYCKLLKTFNNNISAVQVTLDGNKSTHDKRRIRADGGGTFDTICCGISKLLKIGVRVQLRVNVDAENINYLKELKELFDNQGFSHNPLFKLYAAPVRCYNYSKRVNNIMTDSQMFDALVKKGLYGKEDSLFPEILSPVYGMVTDFFKASGDRMKPWKHTYCEGTSGSLLCFTPDGNIFICLTCAGNSDYRIGTFDETGIKIDKDRLNMWKNRDCFTFNKCKNCKFVFFCGGGCSVESLENHNDINCPECDDVEKTLEVYVKHNKDKFLKMIKK